MKKSIDDQAGGIETELPAPLLIQTSPGDHQVVLPQPLFNPIEPPTNETVESMISAIEQQMEGAAK